MFTKAFHWPRFFLSGAVVLALVVACAPAAQPTPTPKPGPGGTAPAPAVQPTPVAAQPAPVAQPTPAPKPAVAAPTAKPAAPATPRKTVKLKYGTATAIGFNEVPIVAAFEALKAEGIEVEPVQFPSSDVGTKSLINGQVDFGITNVPGMMAANKAGADLRVFFSATNNEWMLVTPTSIKDPKALDGKRVAHHTAMGVSTALTLYVGKKYNIKPEYLKISGGPARMTALVQGQIDATALDPEAFQALGRQKPGAFHPLIVFEKELPGILTGNYYTAKRERLEADPETWQTLTTFLLRFSRQANENPEWVANQAVKYLPKVDRAEMLATAKMYSQNAVFTTHGGLKKEKMGEMLDFYADTGVIKKEDLLPLDQWATTKFVEAANAKLGR